MWGVRTLVRFPNPKIQKSGDKTIEGVFIGYAQNSKAYRFLSIEDRNIIDKHSIIELRDAIFFENTFSYKETSVPNASKVLKRKETINVEKVEPRRSKRKRELSYNLKKDFYLYLVECDRNEITNLVMLLDIDEDPKAFKEAKCSRDASFWKEAINDEMNSIIKHGTW